MSEMASTLVLTGCFIITMWMIVAMGLVFAYGAFDLTRMFIFKSFGGLKTSLERSFEAMTQKRSPRAVWWYKFCFYGVGAAIALFVVLQFAYPVQEHIEEVRGFEQVPLTEPAAALPGGEVRVVGEVESEPEELVRGPYTNSRSVYVEHEKRILRDPSNRDAFWEREARGSTSAPIFLEHDAGRLEVGLDDGVDVDLEPDYDVQFGDTRYEERRIDAGDTIYVTGMSRWVANTEPGISFSVIGAHVPIYDRETSRKVSDRPITVDSNEVMIRVLGLGAGALFFLVVAIVLMCKALQIHRTWQFLSLASGMFLVAMAIFGLYLWNLDLSVQHEQTEQIREEVTSSMEYYDEQIRQGRLDLDAETEERLRKIRASLAHRIDHTNEQLTGFPAGIVASFGDYEPIEPIELDGQEQAYYDELSITYPESASFDHRIALPLSLSLFPVGVVLIWVGFAKLGVRRLIENVAPTPVDGVVYGLNEIRGTARSLTSDCIQDPVSGNDALYFHLTVYDIIESDNGGKAYQKVDEKKDQVPICCEDETGSIPIRLENAEVSSVKMARQRKDGRVLEGRRIEPGDELYVLGSATVDFSGQAHLEMTGADDEYPYLVSNRTPENLKMGYAHSGFFWFGLAMAAMLLASVAGLAYFGLFGPLSLSLSGLFALMPIPLCYVAFLYNDLIFLRRRVDHCWSNIDVSMQKRADLIPTLEQVVGTYFSHEQDLQRHVAEMRRRLITEGELDPDDADEFMASEKTVVARLEAHPEVMAEEAVEALHNELVALEDEIALMRNGYNDAVERYNTRIRQFPEVLLALPSGFSEVPFFGKRD